MITEKERKALIIFGFVLYLWGTLIGLYIVQAHVSRMSPIVQDLLKDMNLLQRIDRSDFEQV